ncbi:anthranilate phosphoribosyltransferase [bacterium]|nr:anthranilate phosphoribosyltransferase [bacterium]
MIKEMMNKIVEQQDLSREEARLSMEIIMKGAATSAQIAAFITALRMKGETVEEITGCAQAMRAAAATIQVGADHGIVVDTCGTGGDHSNTFNISSAVAIVAAAAGLTVAKHGNRSVSSKSGSADVLETLGVQIALPAEKVQQSIEQAGIGFLFAPNFHPAMKHAGGPRREIGIRTIFNILGPLCNPAQANVQVLGVYAAELTEVLADVLGKLGVRKALVVHGNDHLDEFSITGPTQVSEVNADGKVKTYTVTPEDFGLATASLQDIQGGDAQQNAEIMQKIFNNEAGAKLDAVLMNSAAILVAAEKAKDFKQGVEQAREIIASGKAKRKLAEWIEVSRKLAG